MIKKAKKKSFKITISELTNNPNTIWKIARWAKNKNIFFKNPPQLPDLNNPDEIIITPEEKIKTLK